MNVSYFLIKSKKHSTNVSSADFDQNVAKFYIRLNVITFPV